MPEEGFLRRWARMKASPEAVAEAPRTAAPAVAAPVPPAVRPAVPPAAPAAVQQSVAPDPAQPVLTLEDAARLTPESDFSAFVSQGVDKDVRRLALKKLFADPHFNVPDRLDMYMDDYNQPSPVSATMLAALQHARSALRTPDEVQAELARLAARDAPLDATLDAAAQAVASELTGAEAEAGEGGEQGAAAQEVDTDRAGSDDPDTLVQLQLPAETAAVQPPLPTPPLAQPTDPIALHSPRAHNAEANP
jgi:hypothetical protein